MNITLNHIITTVCKHRKLSTKDIMSITRKKEIRETRQIIMYFAVKYKGQIQMSINRIGQRLNKNHVTVIHAAQRIKDDMNCYPLFREEMEIIDQKINGCYSEVNTIDEFKEVWDKNKQLEYANMKIQITNLTQDNIALNNMIRLYRDKIKRLENPYSLIH